MHCLHMNLFLVEKKVTEVQRMLAGAVPWQAPACYATGLTGSAPTALSWKEHKSF